MSSRTSIWGARSRNRASSDEAVSSYRKALSIDPDYVAAHYNLGNALKDQGKLDEALASYQKAISLRPDLAQAHNNAGLVLQALGRSREAVDSYRKAISLTPNDGVQHNNLAVALSELGQFDAAVASYQRALELKDAAEFKANFVQCVKNHVLIEANDGYPTTRHSSHLRALGMEIRASRCEHPFDQG